MRRSSMRRGSAVLLTILPLFSPAYGLPTYFGNDAAAMTHSNVERAAAPEPAADLFDRSNSVDEPLDNIASEGPEAWLPKQRRQFGSNAGASNSFGSNGGGNSGGSGSVSLDIGGSNIAPLSTGVLGRPHIPNTASEGSDNWLASTRSRKREAEPVVTLDTGFVPPTLDSSNIDLGPHVVAPAARQMKREAEAEAEAEPVVTLDTGFVPPTLDSANIDLGPHVVAPAARQL